MNEFDIRAFVHAAECSSLSKAALLMKVSQPTVSRNIRSLEEQLATLLLVRHGRGVVLTEDGVRFLEHAKRILTNMETARLDLLSLKSTPEGIVRFGMPTSVGSTLFPKLAKRAANNFPNVSLIGFESGSVELFEWLLNGKVDAAVIHEPDDGNSLIIEEVWQQDLFLVGAPLSEFADRAKVTVADIAKLPLILPLAGRSPRTRLERAAAKIDQRLNCVSEVNSGQLMRAMAVEGIGYAMLPYPYIADDVRQGRLAASLIDDESVKERLCIVTTTFNPVSVATRAIASMVGEEFRSIDGLRPSA